MFWVSIAHVKWFTTVMPGEPAALSQVLNPVFLAGGLLAAVVAVAMAWLNQPLQELPWVRGIHARFEQMLPWVGLLVRVGMAIPLIFGGLDGYLFHFELVGIPGWMRLAEVLLGLGLLVPRLARASAAGVILLYLAGTLVLGIHPLLDYISWLGAAYFVAARGTAGERATIPFLYITTGLSLSWAAVEKWVYPHMSLDILLREPIPTFGVDPQAFLILAGWVELGVGYLLITGVLNRFLSAVVTGLFVATSSLFGARELIGHWQLHAALLVFLAVGTGPLVTPVLWHRNRPLQLAFVGVTLLPFTAGLIWLFYALA